jgi:hypothetical protein
LKAYADAVADAVAVEAFKKIEEADPNIMREYNYTNK